MSGHDTESDTLAETLARLRSYLQAAGWTSLSATPRESMWRPRASELGDLVIALPGSIDFGDAERDVFEAINTLAYAERRSTRELLADLTVGGADSVSVRLVPSTPPGRAPLSLAHDSISALRQFVVGSAAAIFNKSLVLPSRRPILAETYAANTQLATVPGSFVLDLTLPLGVEAESQEESDALLPDPQPLGRQVAERMQATARGALDKAATIVLSEGDVSDFANPTLRLGNATELEALALLGGERLDYQLRFTQSAFVPGQVPARIVSVSRRQQEVLMEASTFLRTYQPQENVTVEGPVVRLYREKNSGPGEITIGAVLDDSGQEKRCRLSLSEADYAEATQAHLNGLRVRATGDVVAAGKFKRLERPRNFHVVEDALGWR